MTMNPLFQIILLPTGGLSRWRFSSTQRCKLSGAGSGMADFLLWERGKAQEVPRAERHLATVRLGSPDLPLSAAARGRVLLGPMPARGRRRRGPGGGPALVEQPDLGPGEAGRAQAARGAHGAAP